MTQKMDVPRLIVGGPRHGEMIAFGRDSLIFAIRDRFELTKLPDIRHCLEMDEIKGLTGHYQHTIMLPPSIRTVRYDRVRFHIHGQTMTFWAVEGLEHKLRKRPMEFWSLARDAHFIWRRNQRASEARMKSKVKV